MTMASSNDGKTSSTSIIRMIATSTTPPAKAAMRPSEVPVINANPATEKPMRMESRAP